MTLLDLEHVLQQSVLTVLIIVVKLVLAVVIKSHSFTTVHVNILLVTRLSFISCVGILIRLIREERPKLSSLSSVCHARSFSSETTDASLRMMRDRTLGTSTRNTSLPTCRFSANYFDVVNLFWYFQPFFVEESHMWHLIRFSDLFLWKFLESR